MSYVGNVPTTAAFPFDQFSGNGSTTAFTLSYAPAGTTSIIVSISGVVQNPNTYSVSGTTLTFTPAPPTGSNNIAVLYLGLPVVATLSPGNTAYFSSSVFTATAGQTVFTPSGTYQTGFINVIRNGSQLAPANYTATNGTTVTLNNACTAGDIVVIEVFNLTSIAGALPVTGGTVTGATTFNSTVQVNGANVSGFTGFKNRIINPGMDVAQRGTSFSTPANSAYTLDRWFIGWIGAAVATVAQVAGPTGFRNALRITGAASNTQTFIVQRIESLNCSDLSGQNVTLQANIAVSSPQTVYWQLAHPNTQDNYAAATVIAAGTWSATTTATTFTATITNLPAGAVNGLQLLISPNNLGAFTSGTFTITGVQLERGSNATSYEFRSYGQELALCQRYYYTTGGETTNQLFALGQAYTTSQVNGIVVPFPVTMRSLPTFSVSAVSDLLLQNASGSGGVVSAISQDALEGSAKSGNLRATRSAAGLTAGNASILFAVSTAARLNWSSEL